MYNVSYYYQNESQSLEDFLNEKFAEGFELVQAIVHADPNMNDMYKCIFKRRLMSGDM